MESSTTILLLAVLVSQAYAAPQLISFSEGKLGVNFGGYHAAVGVGGLLGGGAGGGLFAEAGTPHGQSARAGLGGAVDSNGGSAGGLYAGATAGGNVKAHAGLGGGITAEKAAGTGFASAQAGNHVASSGLGGESSVEGASGFTFSGSKSFGVSTGAVKHAEVAVHPVQTVEVVQPIETVEVVKPVYKEIEAIEVAKPVHKEIQTQVKVDTINEVNPLPLAKTEASSGIEANFDFKAEASPPVIYKEVYVQPPPTKVIHKEYVRTHYKPHRHHLRKTAYLGGYIGGGGDYENLSQSVPPPPAPVVYKTVQPVVYKTVQQPVVYKSVQPVIEKRVDVGLESGVDAGGYAGANVGAGGGAQFGYTKNISVQRNPTFFADIFNIPISTLKAVGNFLGNTAAGTSVSVQKSASVQAGGYV